MASALRRLAWFVLAGAAVTGAIQGFATDQLLNTMFVQQNSLGAAIVFPIRALLPVPVLVWAALLSFARIFRLGAAMDDEIKGTV